MLVHKGGKINNWGGECRDVTPTNLQSQNIFKESTGGWGVGSGWGQDGCERRIKVFVKIQKKKLGGGGGGVGRVGWGQGGCERRIEVFVKIKKKFGGGLGEGGGVGLRGGQGGCDRRIEVLGKIQKKNWGV